MLKTDFIKFQLNIGNTMMSLIECINIVNCDITIKILVACILNNIVFALLYQQRNDINQ